MWISASSGRFSFDIEFDTVSGFEDFKVSSFLGSEEEIITSLDLDLLEIGTGEVKNIFATRKILTSGVTGSDYLINLSFVKAQDNIKDITIKNLTLLDSNGQEIEADVYYLRLWDDSNTQTGFRLLSNNEWELAARYINDANSDGDILDEGEFYPGHHASGDITGTCTLILFQPLSSIYGNYAWYTGNSNSGYDSDLQLPFWGERGTNAVGSAGNVASGALSGNSNALGLFDMSGNVCEWVFTADETVPENRIIRDGSWSQYSQQLRVGNKRNQAPNIGDRDVGFRIGKSITP